ncbi:MAG: helix-turn-helix domain-containing protein [Prevotellaceae bacterium]|jgi:plasmid maintenance system antidote protein VapI|nr:helix-turn-helix domain-containing protein [Prevotellaceae bacterium]
MKGSEKINKLLEHFSLNPTDFAKRLGLKYAQNIYDIQSDKVNISKSMANKIVKVFNDIDKNWLLTGEGAMLTKEAKSSTPTQLEIDFSKIAEANLKVASAVETMTITAERNSRIMEKITENNTELLNKLLSTIDRIEEKIDKKGDVGDVGDVAKTAEHG